MERQPHGIGPTGWNGLGLFPCELCWYQRILMYPVPAILGIALWRRDERVGLYVLPLAFLGLAVASDHVALQANPALEAGQCFVGSCSVVDRTFFGLTIPKLSFLAFLLTAALSAWSLRGAGSKAS